MPKAGDERLDFLGVGRELRALERLERRCDAALDVGEGEPERLRAEIDAEEAGMPGQGGEHRCRVVFLLSHEVPPSIVAPAGLALPLRPHSIRWSARHENHLVRPFRLSPRLFGQGRPDRPVLHRQPGVRRRSRQSRRRRDPHHHHPRPRRSYRRCRRDLEGERGQGHHQLRPVHVARLQGPGELRSDEHRRHDGPGRLHRHPGAGPTTRPAWSRPG